MLIFCLFITIRFIGILYYYDLSGKLVLINKSW